MKKIGILATGHSPDALINDLEDRIHFESLIACVLRDVPLM